MRSIGQPDTDNLYQVVVCVLGVILRLSNISTMTPAIRTIIPAQQISVYTQHRRAPL